LDQRQFFNEIVADILITTTVEAVLVIDLTTVDMQFASGLPAPEVTALNALIAAHIPNQGGYPAYLPTPDDSLSLTGTADFVWQTSTGSNILVLNGDTINMEQPMEIPQFTASEVPAVSAADRAILYIDSTTGLLTQVEFGGASGPVGSSASNTGAGAGVFSAQEGGVMYFRGLTGTNSWTQVASGPTSVEFTVPYATISATGAIRLATEAEAAAGQRDDVAISPTGLSTYVAANAGGSISASNTGAGAGTFLGEEGGNLYFQSITGTNGWTQVATGPFGFGIELTVPYASTTATGTIRLATPAETVAGESNDVAVSPTGLSTYTSNNALAAHQIAYSVDGAGTTNATYQNQGTPFIYAGRDVGGGPTGAFALVDIGTGTYTVRLFDQTNSITIFEASVGPGGGGSDVILDLGVGLASTTGPVEWTMQARRDAPGGAVSVRSISVIFNPQGV
jgi:hypothetical protein